MYNDLREVFWWEGYKEDSEIFAKYPNCQQVKVEHQKSCGLLQKILFPSWKWENINKDFVVGFPRRQNKHDSI